MVDWHIDRLTNSGVCSSSVHFFDWCMVWFFAVVYDDHCYVICLSNKKIHVVKRKFSLNDTEPAIALL